MTDEQMQKFINISLALSAERDREELLSRILDTAMEITNCDAGTLYILEDDGLHFCRMVTKSQGVRQGGNDDPITLPPVPLDPVYVCSWAVLRNQAINVEDVSQDQRFDFSGAKKYDEMTGYRTKTMLVMPLANDRSELIGAMQLINALDETTGEVVPFSGHLETMTSALASQAAISLTNMKYAEQIISLLNSLVNAMSEAIDKRTPYNANHTRNMVKYGEAFLDYLSRTEDPRAFDPLRRSGFLMSVGLHDVGKLVVPLGVMDKESRLGTRIKDVENRFATMKLLTRIGELSGTLTASEAEKRRAELSETLCHIRSINTAGFLPDEELAFVDALEKKTYTDEEGQILPWITAEESEALHVRKGTLTAKERSIMEGHVRMTASILDQVSFPTMYADVPVWAASHHELLNGKGYPEHRTAEDIPPEVRLITILDVFDALTARDRPYKKGMPVEKALSILHQMVDEGSIDGEWLALFEKSRAWEETV